MKILNTRFYIVCRALLAYFFAVLFALPLSALPLTSERVYFADGKSAVACGHKLAAQAAMRVLKSGGNAVDASVAAAFMLGVCDFTNSGLGGDGFALVREPRGRVIAFNGAVIRPGCAGASKLKSDIGLPAALALLLRLHSAYGQKEFKTLVQPAIKACFEGFKVSAYLQNVLEKSVMSICEPRAVALIAPNGCPIRAGEVLKQPVLGKTLQKIAKDKGKGFYRGALAKSLIADMRRFGSKYTQKDFANYSPRVELPLKVICEDYEIFACPPPASSLITAHLAAYLLKSTKNLFAQDAKTIINTAKTGYEFLRLKKQYLAKSYNNRALLESNLNYSFFGGFENEKPIVGGVGGSSVGCVGGSGVGSGIGCVGGSGVIGVGGGSGSGGSSVGCVGGVGVGNCLGNTAVGSGDDDGNTTHLCVCDKNGMIVSLTLTLGSHCGSGQLSSAGFFYSNGLRNYSPKNACYPEDYPLDEGPVSAKSPLIIYKGGRPFLAIGGAGSDRIIINTAVAASRLMQNEKNYKKTLILPRFFINPEGVLNLEWSSNLQLTSQIKRLYKNCEIKPGCADYFGLVSAILINEKGCFALADPRRDGACMAE